MVLLTDALFGEAKEAVAGPISGGASFQECMNLVKARYGDEERRIRAIGDAMRNWPKMTSFRAPEARRHRARCTKYLAMLNKFTAKEVRNAFLLMFFEDPIPNARGSEWRMLILTGVSATKESFLQYLDKYALAHESPGAQITKFEAGATKSGSALPPFRRPPATSPRQRTADLVATAMDKDSCEFLPDEEDPGWAVGEPEQAVLVMAGLDGLTPVPPLTPTLSSRPVRPPPGRDGPSNGPTCADPPTYAGCFMARVVSDPEYSMSVEHQVVTDKPLADLERFWQLQECPAHPRAQHTDEERWVADHFRAHAQPGERYQVALPFRPGMRDSLGPSYPRVLRIFRSLRRRLSKDADFFRQYADVMASHFSHNHVEVVPPHEVVKPPGETYYFSHRAVLKPSSTSTKLRIVFNASLPTESGVDLNQALATAPNPLNDLLRTFTHWRTHAKVAVSDVVRMYHQVLVRPADRDFLRFL
ncbi:MAG: hypothetical protein GY701_16535, partial [Sulfitobacter sp.]|nr:hypothetical protein [Sulfitobacter sp.]